MACRRRRQHAGPQLVCPFARPRHRGAAGRWTDAATGEHGDLLDLIAATRRLDTRAALDKARAFLSLPRPEAVPRKPVPASAGSPAAARRLLAVSKPIAGTLAEAYLRARGIAVFGDCPALRFHPHCHHRRDNADAVGRDAWPALVAAVTDLEGTVTGAHRTWLDPSGLDPSGLGKAPVATPRRAMGHLVGNAVRFGRVGDLMAAGEDIETVLSLRSIMPFLPAVAALSAGHLAALRLSPTLRRLYIARDNDPAGQRGADALTKRAQAGGIEALTLTPVMGDFNDDLRRLGINALAAAIRVQLAPEDVVRFWRPPERGGRTR